MKFINYTLIEKEKKYRGKYLALQEIQGKIKIIAFGKDPKKVLSQALAKGCKIPHLKKISANPPDAMILYHVC